MNWKELRSGSTKQVQEETERWGGLGLGLSIVYGMVRVMNGFMRIESEEGRGNYGYG